MFNCTAICCVSELRQDVLDWKILAARVKLCCFAGDLLQRCIRAEIEHLFSCMYVCFLLFNLDRLPESTQAHTYLQEQPGGRGSYSTQYHTVGQ